ncbi:MAG TPA: NAD(P)/FAD-dependent oxidoreductase [Steroidobacteraceae bacterium]|nr:NAD(P)/FAD-dependent oxidoreductase [Steroidobacteraceae bacterium]
MVSRRQFVQAGLASLTLAAWPGQARKMATGRVAIVGAGAAGIAAARPLMHAGFEVVILEARDRIGGRAWTDTASMGVAWDRGGSWLHSSEVNPLLPIARDLGIEVMPDDSPRSLYRDGAELDERSMATLQALTERAYGDLAAAGEQGLDVAASEALSAETRSAELFPIVASSLRGFEGVELEHYSVQDSYHYVEAGPDFLIPSGYGALIARLGRGLPVRLADPVRRIDWSHRSVRLDARSGSIEADAVIVTVPSSVLARNELVFTPALPLGVEQAAHDLPLGLLDKVALRLAPGSLPTRPNEFVSLVDAAPEAFGFQTRLWGSNVVLGYVSGAYAHALELEGERAMIDAATEQLAAIFGTKIRHRIEATAATRWASEPFSFGSYSHCVPGRFGARERFAEPVADRLFFAGEHTEQSAYGTVHGAWISGERAARGVLSTLSKAPARAA